MKHKTDKQNKFFKILNGIPMLHKMFFLSVVLLVGIGLAEVQAQESFNSSGGNSSGTGGSVSYSVGQLFYTSSFGTTGSVAQGVQQPYEISVVIGLEQANNISLQCLAYPNPANEYVKLKVDVISSQSLQLMNYQLFDLNGKLVETNKIVDSETSINMANLVPATYFLKVLKENKEIILFKIIKN